MILMGVLISLFGFVPSMILAALVMLALGAINGYIVIIFTTWLQSRTPEQMMGRVMSLLLVALIGLNPISNALAGAFLNISVAGVFIGAGALMVLLSLSMLTRPEIIKMGETKRATMMPGLSESTLA